MEIPDQDFSWIPGKNARTIVPKTKNLQDLMNQSTAWAVKKQKKRLGKEPRVVVLPDGPYGIPLSKVEP
jgi:hypothetical protein